MQINSRWMDECLDGGWTDGWWIDGCAGLVAIYVDQNLWGGFYLYDFFFKFLRGILMCREQKTIACHE